MYYYGRQGIEHSENIWSGIRESFRKGSALTRLIYINIGIFLLLKIIHVVLMLAAADKGFQQSVWEWLGVPADPEYLILRPWTLITYMFTQFDFIHLLLNMLWLYWFGSFFLNYFTERKLVGVYLLGGVVGAVLYIAAYNIFPIFSMARFLASTIGSSASVMAIVFAVCTYLPQHKIYIFLIGPVKLIYLALFTAAIDLISIPSGNAGGHIAHLGGALFGYLFVLGIRSNKDITNWFTALFCKIGELFSHKKKRHIKYKKRPSEMKDREYNEFKKQQSDKINEILDKISHSGYESLTREEKEILFKSGRN